MISHIFQNYTYSDKAKNNKEILWKHPKIGVGCLRDIQNLGEDVPWDFG